MKTTRRSIQVFSLSFLDVISCGFGAIVLLLVLTLALEPATQERLAVDNSKKEQELINEQEVLKDANSQVHDDIRTLEQAINQLREQLNESEKREQEMQSNMLAIHERTEEEDGLEAELMTVLQKLSEEEHRLQRLSKKEHALIGGVPVVSEYIIFIIDTSGSMLQLAWPTVLKKVTEVLESHPEVKGIQVVNDMGSYMFKGYAGKWIPDSPARRQSIIRQLRTWKSYSNSSPVEGITHAARLYSSQNQKISLYIFGDDFSRGSIEEVLHQVAANIRSKGHLQIHTFGFPTLFTNPKYEGNRTRFAHLMRRLAEQNSGSFVGLTNLESVNLQSD